MKFPSPEQRAQWNLNRRLKRAANPEPFRAQEKASKEKHRDRRLKRRRELYSANSEMRRTRQLAWYAANREAHNAKRRAQHAANPEKVRAYRRQYEKARKLADPHFAVVKLVRGSIAHAIKGAGRTKQISSINLLGCSIPDFILYLESKFETGMTWENRGSVWHLDHIIPCALFDLSKPEHQKRCFHFSNYQPLFAIENRRKHTRIFHEEGCLPI